MKKLFIILTMYCLLIPVANAQAGLNINKIFDKDYHNDPTSVETLITGKKLESSNIDVFHSLTLSDNDANNNLIQTLLSKDAKYISNKEVIIRDGKIKFAIYTYYPINGLNRNLFYIRKNNRIKLIYMEGKATKDDIKNMTIK